MASPCIKYSFEIVPFCCPLSHTCQGLACPGPVFLLQSVSECSLVLLQSVAEGARFLDSVWSPLLEFMMNLKYKN